MSFVQALLSNPAISPHERQKALNRVFSDPGIPDSKHTTSPFWLIDPHPEMSRCQSNTLPTEADVVIIGSGITGASIARTLLQDRAPRDAQPGKPSVVMLEARDLCSGATGRNGGHILETADEFAGFVEAVGMEPAKKIMKLRLSHLNDILGVAEELGLTKDCQARKVQFLNVCFDETTWADTLERFRVFKDGMPDESKEWKSFDRDEIPRELCLPHARGIIAGPAGAVWPYKFVSGVLSHLRKEFPSEFHIKTNTPVKAIHKQNHLYTVETPRGTIRARHVIHCTNAHVGHLVPGLRGRIYAIRGQMSAQTPGDKFPNQGSEHSWIFQYDRGFDYLTQLPHTEHSSGQMMFGGGFARGEGGGLADLGIAMDSGQSLYADIHLSGALSAVFGRENWGTVSGPSVQSMWTGNMGFSADGFPWVGKLPASATQRENRSENIASQHHVSATPGAEWVCAAFSGEGMVHTWLCGKTVASMLLSDEGKLASSKQSDLSWFPEQMLVSEKRIRDSTLPRELDELVTRMSNV